MKYRHKTRTAGYNARISTANVLFEVCAKVDLFFLLDYQMLYIH